MGFLTGLVKKLAANKAQKKVTEKGSGAPRKSPFLLVAGLLGGIGLFHVILILLMVAVVSYIVFAPIEGAVNFVKGVWKGVTDFFDSVGNWFQYGSFADDETTYYNELKKKYDSWRGKGVTLDIAWIASATNYARLADLNDSGGCEPTVDEEGNVSGCNGEDDPYASMTNEIKELVDGMISTNNGSHSKKSKDDYMAWMLDDSKGKSWIERHMEEVGADIPTNPEKKKKYLEDAVEQIYLMKEAYEEIQNSMGAEFCGETSAIQLCDSNARGFTGGYANQNWTRGSNQYNFWNCDKGTCSPSTEVVLGENDYGELKRDELGFTYMEFDGIKYYTAALGTHYFDDPNEVIGSRYRITTDAGNEYYIIMCDTMADIHAHPGNMSTSIGCLSSAKTFGDMYFDAVWMEKNSPETYKMFMSDGTNNHDFDEEHKFSGTITSIDLVNSSEDCAGEFGFTGAVENPIKEDSKISVSYNLFDTPDNPFPRYQCTWFAWARFKQIYGFDSGARGNGNTNSREVVAAHPDKFKLSSTPAPGAVFSQNIGTALPQYGHVGIVEAFDGTNLWLSEGNVTIGGYSSAMWFHKTTWAAFHAQYPDATFAIPINPKKNNKDKDKKKDK